MSLRPGPQVPCLAGEAAVGYVVAVPKSQSLRAGVGYGTSGLRADEVTADAPERRGNDCRGDGVKGPRLYDWAMATSHHIPTTTLVARHPSAGGCWSAAASPPTTRVNWSWPTTCAMARRNHDRPARRCGRARWAIEECFQSAKNEVGLDSTRSDASTAGTAHHPGHARPRLPGRHRRPRPKAAAAWSPSPSPRPPSPGTPDQRRPPTLDHALAWSDLRRTRQTELAAPTTGNAGCATTSCRSSYEA